MPKMPFKGRMSKGVAFAAMMTTMVGGFEGLRTVAYKDPVGIPTICFGETKGVTMGMSFTVAECKEMLAVSLAEHEAEMVSCLKAPDAIPDKVYGAALSLEYNIGKGNFCGSTLTKKLNDGDYLGACYEFPKWNKARVSGKLIPLPGLTKRRAAERDLCLEGLK